VRPAVTTRAKFAALAMLAWCLAPGAEANAQVLVVLGPSDNVAIDQPRVAVEVLDPDSGSSLGPETSNTFLLDTGANGILAVGYAVGELQANGYQVEGTFVEGGIAGPAVYDVSAVYDFDFAGTDGSRQSLTGVRLLSDVATDLGGFDGVVGMPGMVDRVTSLDLAAIIDPNEWFGVGFLGVGFSPSQPAPYDHRYSVPLKLVEFSPGNDPVVPTYAPIPFAAASLRQNSRTVKGELAIDTGAQVSIISSQTAFALGLDSDGDGSLDDETDVFMPIQGVGGSIEAPVLQVQRLAIPTSQGVELVWTDLEVPVVDIDPAIPGVIGMDLLTSGWLEPVLAILLGEGDPNAKGYFNKAHFDFRNWQSMTGSMLLDLQAELDNLLLTGDADRDGDVDYFDRKALLAHLDAVSGAAWEDGDFDGDGDVDFSDYQILEANFATALGAYRPCGDCDGDGDVDFADYQVLEANFGLASGASFGEGDFDHDGDVDIEDYDALASNFPAYAPPGTVVPGPPVPEPASLLLLLFGAAVLLVRPRRHWMPREDQEDAAPHVTLPVPRDGRGAHA